MSCAQNNGIYCSDCNNSYIPNNYSNQLKSQGHKINVMKKRCCTCNNAITHSNNHDLTCSMKKVCLESNKNKKKQNFQTLKIFQKMSKQKKKILIKIKTLILMFCYQNFVSYILVIIVIVNQLRKLKQGLENYIELSG